MSGRVVFAQNIGIFLRLLVCKNERFEHKLFPLSGFLCVSVFLRDVAVVSEAHRNVQGVFVDFKSVLFADILKSGEFIGNYRLCGILISVFIFERWLAAACIF